MDHGTDHGIIWVYKHEHLSHKNIYQFGGWVWVDHSTPSSIYRAYSQLCAKGSLLVVLWGNIWYAVPGIKFESPVYKARNLNHSSSALLNFNLLQRTLKFGLGSKSDSTMGQAFVLQAANPGSIPSISQEPLCTTGSWFPVSSQE